MRAVAFARLVCAIISPGSSEAAEAQPPRNSLQVHVLTDATGGTVARDTREAVTRSLNDQLRSAAFASEGGAAADSIVDVTVVSCRNESGCKATMSTAQSSRSPSRS